MAESTTTADADADAAASDPLAFEEVVAPAAARRDACKAAGLAFLAFLGLRELKDDEEEVGRNAEAVVDAVADAAAVVISVAEGDCGETGAAAARSVVLTLGGVKDGAAEAETTRGDEIALLPPLLFLISPSPG